MRWLIVVLVVRRWSLARRPLLLAKATRAATPGPGGDPVVFVGTPGSADTWGAVGWAWVGHVWTVRGHGRRRRRRDARRRRARHRSGRRPALLHRLQEHRRRRRLPATHHLPTRHRRRRRRDARPAGVPRVAAALSATVHRTTGEREPTRRCPHVVLDRPGAMATPDRHRGRPRTRPPRSRRNPRPCDGTPATARRSPATARARRTTPAVPTASSTPTAHTSSNTTANTTSAPPSSGTSVGPQPTAAAACSPTWSEQRSSHSKPSSVRPSSTADDPPLRTPGRNVALWRHCRTQHSPWQARRSVHGDGEAVAGAAVQFFAVAERSRAA